MKFVQQKNFRLFGPAIWVPDIEERPWQARALMLRDPFGNHPRLSEPADAAAHAGLPRWAG